MSSSTIKDYVSSSAWYKQGSLLLECTTVGGIELQKRDSSKFENNLLCAYECHWPLEITF
jgi:hypothetical protein